MWTSIYTIAPAPQKLGLFVSIKTTAKVKNIKIRWFHVSLTSLFFIGGFIPKHKYTYLQYDYIKTYIQYGCNANISDQCITDIQ